MNRNLKHPGLRVWAVPAASTLVVVLVAAGVDMDQNWARLKGLPLDQRAKLVENLKKFDLVLTSDQQTALRDLDRRIFELPLDQQAEYLTALRRFHNWLNRLPENSREEVLSAPPAERMALVQKLVGQHPSPRADTPRFIKIADPGEYSVFELAAIYKIWQVLSPAQRQEVERVPLGPPRREKLMTLGELKEIPREIQPDGFDEKHWIGRLEEQWKKARALLPLEELKKKQQPRWMQIARRQAINLYFLAHAPAAVTSERLEQFAAGFPSWVETTFDPYPPDEARRRLTIVYRLVFPAGSEIKPAGPPAGAGKGQAQGRAPGAPSLPSRPGRPSTPF
jgi:hypothetical protein